MLQSRRSATRAPPALAPAGSAPAAARPVVERSPAGGEHRFAATCSAAAGRAAVPRARRRREAAFGVGTCGTRARGAPLVLQQVRSRPGACRRSRAAGRRRTAWPSRTRISRTMPPSWCCTVLRLYSTLSCAGATTAPASGAVADQATARRHPYRQQHVARLVRHRADVASGANMHQQVGVRRSCAPRSCRSARPRLGACACSSACARAASSPAPRPAYLRAFSRPSCPAAPSAAGRCRPRPP